jgi:succinate-acetate transporter protein
VSRRDAFLLKAAVVWTVFVWGVFLRNLFMGDADRSVGFKVVHTVLAVVSLTFAAGIWAVAHRGVRATHASRSRQRTHEQAGTSS